MLQKDMYLNGGGGGKKVITKTPILSVSPISVTFKSHTVIID